MKFCSDCGATVSLRIPSDDNRLRYICDTCSMIHYQNPKIVTGCIPIIDNQVLLCKRAIEPRHGLWTLPGGFMENDETISQAAMRETVEEANANVEITKLFSVYDIPHVNQVYIMYLARLKDTHFGPGTESLEVELFRETEIPWDDIAFKVITETLLRYFEDLKSGQFTVHQGIIKPRH